MLSGRYVHESLGSGGTYDLYAVVVHTGAVLAGHYFSFMRPEVRP
jgi:ubiquitin C-terminal hydrolase